MSDHFLYYTKPEQAAIDLEEHGADGIGLDHWASNQFKKVQPGDHLWIMTIDGGELLLIGHMEVRHVMNHSDAVKFVGRKNLYARTHHVVCSQDDSEHMGVVNIHPIASLLRFKSPIDRLVLDPLGHVTAFQIQSMRRLTSDSVKLLEAQWYEPEPPDDWLGTGYQSDPELRRRIEQAAISYVTACLTDEGWDVESVEAERCGYDLHCTDGKAERHVEVKGTAGDGLGFIITIQELTCAREDEFFELWAVTNALDDNRTARKYLGSELDASFDFDAIQFRAMAKMPGEYS